MLTSVLSVAPLRISFVGGGTDIPEFYKESKGSVVSCAIQKYVYVHVKIHDKSFQEKYRISYSEVEHSNERSKIKNTIVKACLEFLDIDFPLQISTSSDLPAGSGLGSSSSFTTSLLLALHALRGEKISSYELADEACKVEMDILGKPIGKQDQFSASFGGINLFNFLSSGQVEIYPIKIQQDLAEDFMARCCLFWTGKNRSADEILANQVKNIPRKYYELEKMAILAQNLSKTFESKSLKWNEIAAIINQGWEIKMNLNSTILNNEIREIGRAHV